MAVFRIERTRDYTVMSNHHLRNGKLSLKAKGLLSMMLSLPEDWNYTTRGLAAICKEGVDAIGGALRELETAGYIVRHQLRDRQGRISDTEYVIYAEANAAEYLKEFKVCEKLLMIGQRKNITDAAIVSDLIGADVDAFVAHFFQFAYAILPGWQYDDVKFYEDFAFAVLSQYSDLYEKYQLNILLDVADLYIKHGDFGHGDECYGYILRDNQIKDYIYYRFASVYEDIDFNKAKALAYESLQYVDGRYTYYQNIMDIINK